MTERYTMDAHDLYDGDRPLRDTDIRDRLNEQDDDLTRLRATVVGLNKSLDICNEAWLKAGTERDQWHELASQLQQRSHEAFTLLGQMDYFLQSYHSQPIGTQNKQAAKLRDELKQLVGLK